MMKFELLFFVLLYWTVDVTNLRTDAKHDDNYALNCSNFVIVIIADKMIKSRLRLWAYSIRITVA